jgi:hypothetical protein
VSQFLPLGLEVFFCVLAGTDFAGNALDDLHSSAFQRVDLVRIIGE